MYIRILIGLGFLTVSVLCLTADEIEAEKSGWSIAPNTQYHVQTDEGPERYFRFQTLNGQYRKEKRLADGTVIGTEGWLDPLGYLRLKDYIADHEGFRILRSKMVYIGKDKPIQNAIAETKSVPAQTGILAKPRRPPNPFRQPETNDIGSLSGNDLGYYGFSTPKPRVDEVSYAPQSRNEYYYGAGRPNYEGQNPHYFVPQPIQALQAPAPPYESLREDTSSVRTNYRPITAISRNDYPPYDGTYTTANGFQYYLKRHYHEEKREPTGDSVGSFGYIDPFGIRRVVYYKADPQTGEFVHKKNNRYVGFSATPYDPLPPVRTSRRRDTSSASKTTTDATTTT